MIPILFDMGETAFASNGLGRLRDCLTCEVTEERNGVYELAFTYPVGGAHFDEIIPGRIVLCRHDDTDDLQPFDIVGYTKPIDGVVEFRGVHISYRQTGITAAGTNINTLADALTLLSQGQPSNPFSYSADFSASGYMAAADGVPRSVRSFLGGVEGSILDTYGGEYEWNTWRVILHKNRGQARDLTIRYGVNMTDYTDEADYSESFTSCIPYWVGDDGDGSQVVVTGARVSSGGENYAHRVVCVPLDLTEKFEEKPTEAELRRAARAYMQANQTHLPAQTITVDFARLQDFSGYEEFADLLECRLCDTVGVEFPAYGMSGRFKIVRTVFDVLAGRYSTMELGSLSASLAEALGISESAEQLHSITNLGVANDLTVGGDATVSGTLTAGNVTATGAVSGASVTASGAVSGATVSASGKLSGASLETSGGATIGGALRFDGRLIKTTEWTVSSAINSAYGGIFRSAALTKDISSFGFSEPPRVFLQSRGLQCWVQVTNVTATQITFYLVRGSSLSSASTVTLDLIAVGATS